MNKKHKIINLISVIRSSHSEMSNIFSYGSCINFHLILRSVYPEAEMWYKQIQGHIITKIDDSFYDINGFVYDVKDATLYCDIYSNPRRGIKFMLNAEYIIRQDDSDDV